MKVRAENLRYRPLVGQQKRMVPDLRIKCPSEKLLNLMSLK